jgi:hypothetical protein
VGLLLMGRPLTVAHATALHHRPIHVLARHDHRAVLADEQRSLVSAVVSGERRTQPY